MRVLTNGAWLARHGDQDDALAQARLRIVGPNRLEQTMRYDRGWTADAASMILDDSAGLAGRLEPMASHVLFRLDGDRPLRDVIDKAVEDT